MTREKHCARCDSVFYCGQNDIQSCFCIEIKLSSTRLQNIASSYADCLCVKCLAALSAESTRIMHRPK